MESNFIGNADIDLEIETLIHPSYHLRSLEDQIHGVIHPISSLVDDDSLILGKERPDGFINKKDHPAYTRPAAEDKAVVVRGKDIGDLPTEYKVKGIKAHELPVIGTFVHKNIIPGFFYLVRKLCSGNDRYLFKKQPLALQRVGLGYGKRITFESELKNSNNNYFYSDTIPHGYGFSIIAVSEGATFTVLDADDCPAGEGIITQVGIQKEQSSDVHKNGSIVKAVSVTFSCDLRYGSNKHGLMPLFSEETLELTGRAIVVKKKNSRKAVTQCIEQLDLPYLGTCTFQLAQ